MTNADKIRIMPIKEMAEFLKNKGSCPSEWCPKKDDFFADCSDCWMNWLKAEYEEEV